MIFGLAFAVLQGAPVHAQTGEASIFKVVHTPNENQSNNDLFAASASSPNDIWAVGQSTIHFDGTKWTAFPAPLIKGNNTAFLKGVVDISPTSAWAVGFTSGNNPLAQIIERWDGTEWRLFPNPKFPPNSEATLFAMASTSANDIWAVGDFVENDTNLDFNLFEHWHGTAWTATTVQVADNSFESLSGASTDTTNDAWAVGFSTPGIPEEVATLTLILHWDGTSWKVVPSPNVGPNSPFQSNSLLGLTANSANDIWAFGDYF